MRFIFIFIAIFVLISAQIEAKPTEKTTNIFQRNFQQLHKEPEYDETIISRAGTETLWIEQKLDNFDESNNQTWKMRYMANDEYFKTGGPIFIFVGGEWAITPGRIQTGHFVDMAREHNAYLFYTEHRYYGESYPTDLLVENLKYLSVRQALADLAQFIRTVKSTIPGLENSKVILAGGSYSATMVTWFRKLYPELATGCWASSAPLLAKLDFLEYKITTGESIKEMSGDACYNRIANATAQLESMLENKRFGEVKAMLKLCDDVDEYNDLDIWTMFSEISDYFAGVVQTHSGENIQKVCNQILDHDDDLIGYAKHILEAYKVNTCLDLSYLQYIKALGYTGANTNIMRQWTYQTCTEFGFYQTSTSIDQPFGTKFPLDYYTTTCADLFGDVFTQSYIESKINDTNNLFGGMNPEVTNVYFTQGALDPWHTLGIRDETRGAVLPRYAHCKDLASISDKDTLEMRASKLKLAEQVRLWLQ